MYKMEIPEEIHKQNEENLMSSLYEEQKRCEMYRNMLSDIFGNLLQLLSDAINKYNYDCALYSDISIEAQFDLGCVNSFKESLESDNHVQIFFIYGGDSGRLIKCIEVEYDGKPFSSAIRCRIGKNGKEVN